MTVAVLIVCFNGGSDVLDCLQSLRDHRPPETIHLRIIVVDNHSEDGSVEAIAARFPEVDLVQSEANLGFAGGNNLGWSLLCEGGAPPPFVFLLNQDATVEAGWLSPLLALMDASPSVAGVQPLIMLKDQPRRINTAANRCHFLGYTFIDRYLEQPADDEPVQPLDAASGAAVLLRTAALGSGLLFEPLMFLYCEDVELSWRLRLQGWKLLLEPKSRVRHVYRPQVPETAYFYLERNRWWLLLACYKVPTLLLLLPALLVMEVGQWFFACTRGIGGAKLRSWRSLLSRPIRRRIWQHRAELQARRILTDQALTQRYVGYITYPGISGTFLHRIGNPLLVAYWQVARRLIRW